MEDSIDPKETYKRMRELKRKELEGLVKQLELIIERLNALRLDIAMAEGASKHFSLKAEFDRLEHQKKELMILIDETEKTYRGCPLENLPCPPNPDWVERDDEQQEFHELLQKRRRQHRELEDYSPVYLCCNGLPGVGKTQFVLKYAQHRLGRDYNTVVWIDGSGTDLRNATAKAARELNLVNGASPSNEQLIAALRSHLAQGGPHLVIIDNVDVPAALSRYLPRRGDVSVVITARQKELPFVSLSYKVELLDPARALRLLRGPEPLVDSEEEKIAVELCEYLGNLPLALMLARRVYRARPRSSFRELFDSIKRIGPARWRPSVDVEPYLLPFANLSALFEVSYQLLGPDARWLAAVGGYFGAALIDRDLLCAAGAALAQAPIASSEDKERWEVALEQIDRIGLFEHTVDQSVQDGLTSHTVRVRIHRLLQDYLRSVHNDENAARSAVCDALAQKVRKTPLLAKPLRELRHHLTHFDEVLHHSCGDLKGNPSMYQVLLGVVRYSSLMGDYKDALNRCNASLPATMPETAAREWIDLRHQRAFALRNLCQYDLALADYQDVLQWRQQNLGPDNLWTYFAQHDMGAIYLDQRRFDEAHRVFTHICESMKRLLAQCGKLETFDGDDQVRMLQISRALALTDLGRAELRSAAPVAFPEPDEGGPLASNSPEESLSLAAVQGALQRLSEARRIFEQMRMWSDLFMARPLVAQAEALRLHTKLLAPPLEQRREVLRQAEELATRARGIRQNELSSMHPHLIVVYEVLGRIYTDLGESEKAKTAYEHAILLSKLLLGR